MALHSARDLGARRLVELCFAGAAPAPGEVRALTELARHEGLYGFLADRFGPEAVPAAMELRYERVVGELVELLGALDRAGVRPVLLKGPALGERLYPDRPALRPSTDLDLLVSTAERDRATAALAELGYRARPGDGPALGHHVHFDRPGRLTVELHHHALVAFGATLDGDRLVARARTFPYRGLPARLLGADDELLQLIAHAASHRFERLIWLVDIQRALAAQGRRIDELAGLAAMAGFGSAHRLTALRLAELFGASARPRGVRLGVADRLARPSAGRPQRIAFAVTMCDSPARAIRLLAGQARAARTWLPSRGTFLQVADRWAPPILKRGHERRNRRPD